MTDYVAWIRSKVGHDPIFLNAASAIIANEQGEVLFQKRGDFRKEAWGLPGGMMEIEESASQTVIREVREETGLDITGRLSAGRPRSHTLKEVAPERGEHELAERFGTFAMGELHGLK